MFNERRPLILSRDPAVQHCHGAASEIHAKDKRIISGNRYVVHCEAVGKILQRLHFGADVICAGLLHDTVEEHQTLGFDELTEKLISPAIDERRAMRIARLVRAVTIDPEWPDRERYERYCGALEEYPEAIPIAVADRYDNLLDIKIHLMLQIPVFSPKYLNLDPRQMMIDCLTVAAACSALSLRKDRMRVTMLTGEIAALVNEIRRLLAAARKRK